MGYATDNKFTETSHLNKKNGVLKCFNIYSFKG